MGVWEETTRAVTRLLTAMGGFRTVHTWRLEWQGDEPHVRDHLGHEVPGERVPHLGSGTGGRRLVLLVSDCAAAGWHGAAPWLLLRNWGEQIPVALLDPLPPRLWRRSALDLPAVRVTAERAGDPNRALRFRLPARFRPRPDTDDPHGPWSALPVLSCGPHSVGAWARTLMRTDPRGCDAVLVPATGRLRPARGGPAPARRPDPEELAEAFLHTAPAPAVRLAVLCSGLPDLPLPLLHILREEVVPDAGYADLAELLTSGLFTVRRDTDGDPLLVLGAPARARLRAHLTRHDVWRARAAFSRHAAAHPYAPGGVAAVLHDPTAPRRLAAQPEPFAESAAVRENVGTASGPFGGLRATAQGVVEPARPDDAERVTADRAPGPAPAPAVYEAVRAQVRSLPGPPLAPPVLRDTELLLRRLVDYTCSRLPAPLGDWPSRNTLFDDPRPRGDRLTLAQVVADVRDQLAGHGIRLEGPTPAEDAREQGLIWGRPGALLHVTVRKADDFSWPEVTRAVRTMPPSTLPQAWRRRVTTATAPVEFLLILDDSDKPGGLQPLSSCVVLVERAVPGAGAVVVLRVQTRLGRVRRETRDALAAALRDLHKRAGAPTHASLAREADRAFPPVRLSTSTLSDWFRGKAVPADERSFGWLVDHLARRTGPDSDPLVTVAQLTELRERALQRGRDSAFRPAVQLGQPVAELFSPAVRPESAHYAVRAHDALLRAVVSECAAGVSRLVLLVGPPGSGKTTSAREALRHLPPGWRLWEPRLTVTLLEALRNAEIGPRTVIWLGNAELHLGALPVNRGERIAAGLLARLRDRARGPVLVLGTLRTESWNTFISAVPPQSEDRLRRTRDLCRTAVAVPVSPPGDTTSLSYLGQGVEAILRYTSASVSVRAVVDIAVDARRYGHAPEIPGALLSAAARGYLNMTEEGMPDLALPLVDDLHSAGLLRVRARTTASPALFRLSEHIERYGREIRRHATPPESLWNALALHAPGHALEAAAGRAEQEGDWPLAERLRALAWQRVSARTVVRHLTRDGLDADEVTSAADRALNWLAADPRAERAEQVIHALLTRPDLSPGHREQTTRHALDLLRAREGAVSAQLLLATVLMHGTRTAEVTDFLLGETLRWLARHGDTADSRFVHAAALGRDDFPPDARRRVVRYALDWLEPSETPVDGAHYVLAELLRRDDLSVGEAREAVASAMRWLGTHGLEFDAHFVLSQLVGRADLARDDLTRACDHAVAWLGAYGADPSAEHVLAALLSRTDLDADVTDKAALAAGLRQIVARQRGDEPDAGLRQIVARQRGDEPDADTGALDGERDHLLLAVDVAGLAEEPAQRATDALRALDDVLHRAVFSPPSPRVLRSSDTGDGRIIVFEPGSRNLAQGPDLLGRLERALHEIHDRTFLRLRLVLHRGEAGAEGDPLRGAEAVTVARLADSVPLRAALAAASDAVAAVAVSDPLFHTVFSPRPDVADSFRQVHWETKEGTRRAWISVAGHDEPPGIEPWSGPPRTR
jgi:hypothetical protein